MAADARPPPRGRPRPPRAAPARRAARERRAGGRRGDRRGRLAPLRARARPGGAARAPRPAAGGDRARLLRRLHAVRARGSARTAARYDQEQDVRRPAPAARAPRRGHREGRMEHGPTRTDRRLRARRPRRGRARALRGAPRRGCESCREELAAFWEVASALAVAAGGADAAAGAARADPRAGARRAADRRAARAPRPRRRARARPRRWPPCVAIGLGIWALSLSGDLDDAKRARWRCSPTRTPRVARDRRRRGDLVVSPSGRRRARRRGARARAGGQGLRDLGDRGRRPAPAGLFERRRASRC